MITVFTPTYNRAYIIEHLYESLVKQSSQNFEWLIVDDGSTDNTQEIVSEWQKSTKISITYIRQKNQGKHAAINTGLCNANGDLFFIVDSDDSLSENAIEFINGKYNSIKHDSKIAGISGRRFHPGAKVIGNRLPAYETLSNALDIRLQHKVTGDMAEVYKTIVIKDYLFPVFENEKFCPEALVWNRIAQKYSLIYYDEPIYKCEYLEDGLTKKITRIRMLSPEASMLHYSELESYNIPFLEKVKANINYWRFSFNSKKTLSKKISKVNLFRSLIGFPIGILFYLNDLRQ